MDKVTKEVRRKTMQAIRSQDTKIELKFRKQLFNAGIRFRKNVKDLPGKPDVAIKSKKVVIFLDSCFWHACPKHFRKPQSNTNYWDKKIARNEVRALEINRYYKSREWEVLRFWEHEVEKSIDRIIKKTIKTISSR